SYTYMGGTSMSSPNVSGSLNLLVRYYESTHNDESPLSSTTKAIALHTTDEAGPDPGPDYMFGWGLMNTTRAATLIASDLPYPERIVESSLLDGESDTYDFSSDGVDPVRVTIVWTEPPGTPPPPSLNPTTPMLINDIDIRLEHIQSATTYYPYIMNPSSPSDAATTGDNYLDNVEQIYIESPPAGDYQVTVSHKGTLASEQWYSIIITNELLICVDQDSDGYGDPDNPGNRCPDDNCPEIYNPEQNDPDADDIGSLCDNCPDNFNPGQEDLDFDEIGDACDYICGNVDDDINDNIDILDIVFLVNFVYKNGDDPVYMASANISFDLNIDILDIVHLINFVYKDGADPECE
ncbi:MAG: S8 family serine peptidase, partial [candidate division Zixibacteria bacterium]|nr:S8 family serine peptidase [candidate division Zixibacteria bacterium]